MSAGRASRALLALALAGCAGAPPASTAGAPAPRGPLTRAERTGYAETSRYADVTAFLDSLHDTEPLAFGSIGRTTEGREIPYVIASWPIVRTPGGARATGKPVVYVQANIHAGEVEGKEALLALVRDLARAPRPNVLDSVVLIAVPIYNADGNERFAPQERQRTEQNGPALVGQRPNGMGLDLNRDYVKAEAPETRASLAMFNAWDPDVFVDLHTTDGSFHGYALTYSPSLSPAAPLADYTRDLLAQLRTRVRTRDGYETFDYGNFEDPGGEVSTDTVHAAWRTYDARPRFGTNYYGLRNRIAVLSEAFSHDPFERRVKSTYAFTRELLSLVAEHGREIRLREQQVDGAVVSRGALDLALRSALPDSAPAQPVRFEILARTGDSSRTQPGVPAGIRRTGEIRTRNMPVFDRFVPTLTVPLAGAYLLPATDTALLARLRAHGITMIRIEPAIDTSGRFEAFVVDSVARAARPFQGHNEVRLAGHWSPVAVLRERAAYLVDTHQPLGRLAAFLLDPQSEDGFGTWNAFDARLTVGQPHPVLRWPGPTRITFPSFPGGAAGPRPSRGLMLRRTLLYLSKQPSVFRFVRGNRLAKHFARRFVAGETAQEALDAVRELNAKGITASLDLLGESVNTEREARAARDEYLQLLDRIRESKVDANVSVKLTAMGLDIDHELCVSIMQDILARAQAYETFVRLDMEESAYTDITLRLFEERLYPAYKANVGVVLQSYLYRTFADVEHMNGLRARVRICKGAYKEPASVAYPEKKDVDANYVKCMRELMLKGNYPGIATHDPAIIAEAKRWAREQGIATDRFEFQMLYGVRRDLQEQLVKEGYRVRCYVPFGTQWYPYLMRRLAERPANVMFITGSVVREALHRDH